MRDFIGRYRCIHSKIYYYHTLAEAKEKIIVELYLLPDFPPVSGDGGSRIEDSAAPVPVAYKRGAAGPVNNGTPQVLEVRMKRSTYAVYKLHR